MGSALPKAKKAVNSAERLRLVEQENDELRRQVQKEQDQVERLKREAARSSYVSNKEAKLRVAQLKDEARTAAAEVTTSLKPTSSSGLFQAACSTDLLFLMDCTNSMRRSIDTVKENVKKIVDDISKAFYNEAQIRIAVVGYRDHGAKSNNEALDFTTSTDQVFSFLDGLQTQSGQDIPEDVLGGIHKALGMSWEQPTRCIIHIGDAPPHARIFQEEPYEWDRYPDVGSEPHGLTYEPLFQLMTRMDINYALLPINKSTDRMAFLFSQVYLTASAETTLNTTNRYCKTLNDLVRGKSCSQTAASFKRIAQGRLMFVEAEMGTIYTYLRNLVVKSVLSSATRTATRVSESISGINKTKGATTLTPLAAFDENEFKVDKYELEAVTPQWNTLAWFDEVVPMEGFSPDVIVHSAHTLENMMQSDEKIAMSTTDITIHKRTQPFAQGAMRVAAYGRSAHSTNPLVVKSFKRGGKQLAHLAEEMRCQALCKAFALEFSALAGKEHAIDFIVTTCLKGKSKTATSDERLSLEPFIQGEYVKYNNNCGYVNEEIPNDRTNQAAQAFSHFTFERSCGRFLVSDLQGVANVLTDPAVHTKDKARFRLTDTNLGIEGFKFFFATHECNDICLALQLRSNAGMLLNGSYTFRQTWPSVESTVCCSNKFCGKIVRLESAQKARIYPGFFWCETCWPQIDRTRVRQSCVAPGPHHTFEVSAFFFESQGRLIPRTCPTHRVRDETVRPPSTPDGGGGFLKKLGFGGRNKK